MVASSPKLTAWSNSSSAPSMSRVALSRWRQCKISKSLQIAEHLLTAALNGSPYRKEMVLLGVTESMRAFTLGPMESKGSIVYQFVNADAIFPIIMQNLNDPMPKVMQLKETSGRDVYQLNEGDSSMSNLSVFIHFFSKVTFKMQNTNIYSSFSSLQAIELIKQLAEANKHSFNNTTTEDNIKVYQLLRVIPYEGLETMWKQFAGNREQRWATLC